jgi:4-amino-4-deoxy-L-arabinose transferase-like glycosyltransferase
VALWALALLAPFLLRLGAAPLFDVDEGAFGEATREMLASGDFGFTTLHGAPRFDKPILVYWLQAASVSAFGLNEAALRLPSALCAWGWCLAVAGFAWRRLGARVALLAGTVAATSLGVLAIGRAATADGLLNLLLALAALDAWRHLEGGARAPLLRMYLWIGLGLLAKGPVALVVPAGATLAWALPSGAFRRWLRAAFDPLGWAILLAVAAPWYAYALHRHGMAFVEGFLIRHNVARYTSSLEGHGGSLVYYVVAMPLLVFPWTPLVPGLVRRARALWAEPLARFLLAWAGFVLVFFSLSGTKLPHYGLYGATPLFLLLAREAGQAGRLAGRLVAGAVALVLALVAALPPLAPVVAPRVGDPLYRELIAGGRDLAAAPLVAAALAAAAASLLALRAFPDFPRRAAAAALAAALALTGAATPWIGELVQGPVKRMALLARARPEPAVQWGVHTPSFAVYREQPTPRGEPSPGQLAIVRASKLPADASYEVLSRERGYALVLRHDKSERPAGWRASQ